MGSVQRATVMQYQRNNRALFNIDAIMQIAVYDIIISTIYMSTKLTVPEVGLEESKKKGVGRKTGKKGERGAVVFTKINLSFDKNV